MKEFEFADHQSSPVFVIGSPRSGTSALSWALAQHPGMWTSEESDFIQLLFGYGHMQRAYRIACERPDGGWLIKNTVGYAEFCARLGIGIDQLFSSRAGGRRWIDSSPGYTLMASELALMLPKARFLHLVRDGRAVVNSMINSHFEIDWAQDFEQACFTWAHYIDRGLDFEKLQPERVLRVSHSHLVSEPESTCAEIISFLGEPPDPRPGAFLREGRINSSYDNNVPQDIRVPKSLERLKDSPWLSWSEQWQATFVRIAGAAMARAGLDMGTGHPSLP